MKKIQRIRKLIKNNILSKRSVHKNFIRNSNSNKKRYIEFLNKFTLWGPHLTDVLYSRKEKCNFYAWMLLLLSHFNCIWLLVIPCTVAHQASLSMGFSRQEYWSGFSCPPPSDLPNPGMRLCLFFSFFHDDIYIFFNFILFLNFT